MDLQKNHTLRTHKTTLGSIRGRVTYRTRKPFENNVDQPDGILQLNETQFNCTLKPYEIDEGDFTIGESMKQPPPLSELSPGKKQKHQPGLAKTSQLEPVPWNIFLIIITIVSVLLITYYYHISKHNLNERTLKNQNQRFATDLKNQGRLYNLPKDFLLKIKSGVNTIFNAESAGSFTILYNSGDKNFHKKEFDEMVQAIANVTAQYLRSGNDRIIELDINNIQLANHEELMHSYKFSLMECGVMLVRDLDSLPTNLAMAFHYFCDEYDPLVKKSAIFFTIDKQKCSIQSKSEPHKWIEKCLSEKWRHMRDDNISPLLTRVVDVVVEI